VQQYDGEIEWRSAVELPLRYVADEARSADLVVISANRDDSSAELTRHMDPGDLAMHAGRPVFMVPPAADRLVLKSAMVTWRDAREARRAVSDALPLLQKVEEVAVSSSRMKPPVLQPTGESMTLFPGSIGMASPHLAEFFISLIRRSHLKRFGNTVQTSLSPGLLGIRGCENGYLVASPTISSGDLLSVRFSRTEQMPNTPQANSLVAETKIEVNLNRLSQLFNSLDPSPFHERDLDQDAEEYIVGSAEESPGQRSLQLVIHLPADQLPHTGVTDLATAVHHYFAYRETHERRRLRLLFRDGRIALFTGLAFLLSCMLLRELAFSFESGTISHIIGEGMLIIGWVAMWRPIEIFLYEWVPIRRRCRILEKLSKAPVDVQPRP
jgi:hypothetical protein